ncbi:Phosducin domain-containing protein [Mycena indigotica]|uniref:Phosducin domain-containing protein n=1 Tax=Mycena indigotica TaxID=2126181 RepID=A0A8H6W9G7_9AGAR|nr:Phosducin domain-containing protein [Mycena indigotica]KAF7309692.1 Phosducin domain-containing protein [Mycena indigotica]
MAVNPNEDTEFNDALRKHGIIPPKEVPPPSPSPPPSPTLDDLLEELTPSEMAELAEDAKDEETERAIDAFRRQRLVDERTAAKRARFGRVYPIGREDYTREVTDASSINEEDDEKGLGTGVVCFLYKDGIVRSDRAFQHVRTLAARHPRTKFVSIVGDKCIPNLPDSRIPMFIVYKKGEILNQVVAWGADRDRTLEELELLLIVGGAIILPERLPAKKRESDDEFSDDEEDEPPRRSAATSTNGRPPKNIRKSASDSDFEFDL